MVCRLRANTRHDNLTWSTKLRDAGRYKKKYFWWYRDTAGTVPCAHGNVVFRHDRYTALHLELCLLVVSRGEQSRGGPCCCPRATGDNGLKLWKNQQYIKDTNKTPYDNAGLRTNGASEGGEAASPHHRNATVHAGKHKHTHTQQKERQNIRTRPESANKRCRRPCYQ